MQNSLEIIAKLFYFLTCTIKRDRKKKFPEKWNNGE